jgi:CTP synthase
MQTKYIFIVGGVLSGLGKGIITSSIGLLLKQQGYSITAIKIDPYLNYDAGTMRPTEHGEVWVTDDGGEIDQDLGNYERFLGINLSKENNITSGKIYAKVIEKERKGAYLGQTVQPIPHVTNEIKEGIRSIAKKSLVDFVLIEVGGTVGDYENILFLEAARQLKIEDKAIFIHVGYLPLPSHLGEMKTKPLQRSVRDLLSIGIQPDFIIGRSKKPMDLIRKRKISSYCNVQENKIISAHDVDNIYKVPIILEEQHLVEMILSSFGLNYVPDYKSYKKWKTFVEQIEKFENTIKIGIVGKYFDTGDFSLVDSYISVLEAVKHAAWNNNVKVEIVWIDSKIYEENREKLKELDQLDGVIVPGGFGSSGVEGKIQTIRYCREKDIPFLGLCYGLQLAVIEYARHVCELIDANSTEVDKFSKHPVIDILPEQKEKLKKSDYGATMRLGACDAELLKDSTVYKLYNGRSVISERHRHRYEVNPEYIKTLEKDGLVFSGKSPDRRLMEFLELPNHTYFIATQAHPEFKSRLMQPAPLFSGLMKAAINRHKFSQTKFYSN